MTVPIPTTTQQIEEALKTAFKPGAPEAATQQLGDKFKAMMEKPSMAPPSEDGHPGTLATMVIQQDARLQKMVTDTQAISNALPYMSIQEVTNVSIQYQTEVTMMMADLEVKMGVVESSKSSVETLMKNQ